MFALTSRLKTEFLLRKDIMFASARRLALAATITSLALIASPANAVGITPWTTEADIPTDMWMNPLTTNSVDSTISGTETNDTDFQVAYQAWRNESAPWPNPNPSNFDIEIAIAFADFALCDDPFVACADGASLVLESPEGKTFDAVVTLADLTGDDFGTTGMNPNALWGGYDNPEGLTVKAVRISVTNADDSADDFRDTVVILSFPAGSVTMPTAEQAALPSGNFPVLTVHSSAFIDDNMTVSRQKVGASQSYGIGIVDATGANESGAGVDDLANTGVDMVPGLIGAGALIGAGVVVAMIRRRRASRD